MYLTLWWHMVLHITRYYVSHIMMTYGTSYNSILCISHMMTYGTSYNLILCISYCVYPIRSTAPNRSTPPFLTAMCRWQNHSNCFTLQWNMLHFYGLASISHMTMKTCNIYYQWYTCFYLDHDLPSSESSSLWGLRGRKRSL